MCSKCFKDNSEPTEAKKPAAIEERITEIATIAEPLKPADNPEVVSQADKSKCWNCAKKTGLLGYDCKCGFIFCKNHRLPEQHQCTFDFIAHGKKVLTLNNPVVKNDKLERI